MKLELSKRIKRRRKELIQSSVISLISLIAAIGIGRSVIGGALGRLTLDHLIRSSTHVQEDEIVLVDITENDYVKLFHKKRPLDPAMILQLVQAIDRGGADLIAVDINTAEWPQDWQKSMSGWSRKAAVVWARDFYLSDQGGGDYVMDSLLGRADNPSGECYGVAALGEDGGVLRSFYTGLRVGTRTEPSFITQIVYRAKHQHCLNGDEKIEDKTLIIDFSSQIPVPSASTLLTLSAQKDWDKRAEYKGKIVILGASFHSGADLHRTPIGIRSGLEINGQAVSSELRQNTRTELGEWSSFLIDAGIGILLLAAGIFGIRFQLVATVIALCLSVFLSLLLFRQYYLFVSFLPIVFGIFAHIYLEWSHARKLVLQPLEGEKAMKVRQQQLQPKSQTPSPGTAPSVPESTVIP